MLIAVLGFGRIWSTRPARDGKHAAHFNTTGVFASGKYRHRSRIFGPAATCQATKTDCARRVVCG